LSGVAIGAESSPPRRDGVTMPDGAAGLVGRPGGRQLLRCADQALYAEDAGRNQVVGDEPDMPTRPACGSAPDRSPAPLASWLCTSSLRSS
jgi:hypothetical protein